MKNLIKDQELEEEKNALKIIDDIRDIFKNGSMKYKHRNMKEKVLDTKANLIQLINNIEIDKFDDLIEFSVKTRVKQ